MRMSPVIACLAGVCLAVAGCGGGDDNDGGGEGVSAAKQAFIDKARPICERGRIEARQATQSGRKGAEREVLVRFARAVRRQQRGLAALDAPAEDRRLIEGYIRDLDRSADQIERAAATIESDAKAGQETAAAGFGVLSQASAKTRDYGFPQGVCRTGN